MKVRQKREEDRYRTMDLNLQTMKNKYSSIMNFPFLLFEGEVIEEIYSNADPDTFINEE